MDTRRVFRDLSGAGENDTAAADFALAIVRA
jgi:hypothetical protein